MPGARTSYSHPIEVGWLSTPWPGRVGLTFAPGKRQVDAATGAWERDLEEDLKRLRWTHGAAHLVCLLEDSELASLGIADEPEAAAAAGIEFHRLPIPDFGLPADETALRSLVSQVAAWASAGETVVIHCKGGLGRAGTIGGCVLRAAGLDAGAALADLAKARGKGCPETRDQKDYVRRFMAVAR